MSQLGLIALNHSKAENDAAHQRTMAFVENGWGCVDWSEVMGCARGRITKKEVGPSAHPKRRIEGTSAFSTILADGWALTRYQMHLNRP